MSLSPETRERISGLVRSSPVFLFMKGNPEAPQCGFSAQVVSILNRLVPAFGSFDVLGDALVREGIKDYSEWPTIPQLYVDGEFMGGCDIVLEMYANRELQEALGLPKPDGSTPQLTISEGALAELSRAQERTEGAELHLSVDARFESSLGLGPIKPDDIAVAAGRLTLYLDPESAARANGISIDVTDAPQGRQLTIDNPNRTP